MTALTILFDIRNPQSFLALAPTIELLDELKADADWQPLLMALPKAVVRPAEHAAAATRPSPASNRRAGVKQSSGRPREWP